MRRVILSFRSNARHEEPDLAVPSDPPRATGDIGFAARRAPICSTGSFLSVQRLKPLSCQLRDSRRLVRDTLGQRFPRALGAGLFESRFNVPHSPPRQRELKGFTRWIEITSRPGPHRRRSSAAVARGNRSLRDASSGMMATMASKSPTPRGILNCPYPSKVARRRG